MKTSSLEPYSGCIESAMSVIGSKWTALLLRDLAGGGKRFGELEKSIGSINPRTLSQRLEFLQEQGVIESCDDGYQLTEKGMALIPVLRAMADWGETYTSKTPA